VVCFYDTDNEAAAQYAYRCESEAPVRWDDAPTNGQPAPDRVCDACLNCAYEQGISDRETQTTLMMEMGSEVEDHLCDAVEDPNLGFDCRCGCRAHRRR
jgi:hypothetical protein